MESIDSIYPLEAIVNELVSSEFQYNVLTAKSAAKTLRKLEHYVIMRNEMVIRHSIELKELDSIVEKYKRPLEIREKAMAKKVVQIAELKKRLAARVSAVAAIGQLPPPAAPESDSESDSDRNGLDLGMNPTSLGTHHCRTYTAPK